MAGLPWVPTISICKWASPVAIEVAIRNNKSWFKKTWFKFKKSKSDPFSIYSVTNLQIEKWMSYKLSKVMVYICIFLQISPINLVGVFEKILTLHIPSFLAFQPPWAASMKFQIKVQFFWEGHKNCTIFLMVLTFT